MISENLCVPTRTCERLRPLWVDSMGLICPDVDWQAHRPQSAWCCSASPHWLHVSPQDVGARVKHVESVKVETFPGGGFGLPSAVTGRCTLLHLNPVSNDSAVALLQCHIML